MRPVTPPPSDLPNLPESFNFFYQALTMPNKAIFIKVLRWLWGEVLPLRCVTGSAGLLHIFWAVDLIRVRYGLKTSELSLLTYLYQVTRQGRKYIKSDVIYNSIIWPPCPAPHKVNLLTRLRKLGYIVRSSRNPSASPHLRSSHTMQKVFVCLSPSSVALIHSIEKDIYNLLMRSSLQDITGMKKP